MAHKYNRREEKKKQGEEGRKEGDEEEMEKEKKRKKKNVKKVEVVVERTELQPPLLGAQAFFQTSKVWARVEVRVLQGRLTIKRVRGGGPTWTSFFFLFFPNS
jgi:hypothetical protein